MWIEVYTKNILIDGIEHHPINTQYELVRIEQDYNGTTIYIFKYFLIDDYNYIYTDLEKNMFLQPIISEFYTSTDFIDIKFEKRLTHYINIQININTDLISINTSSILIKSICHHNILTKYEIFTSIEASKKLHQTSFIPDVKPIKDINMKGFKIKLFDYQKKSIQKMANIEERIYDSIQRTFDIEFGDVNIIWDPFYNKIVTSHKFCKVESSGGILADSMGLGKTLTMIGLTHYQKKIIIPTLNNLIFSKATLIVVPSHLSKQWIEEYTRSMPAMKICIILTKVHHEKTTYLDFKNADMIIVTQQFLLNFKNYIVINYMKTSPVSYNREHRMNHLRSVLNEWIVTEQNIDVMTQPLFEYFHFNRLIVDEGHEIFEQNLGNISLNRWLLGFLVELKASHKWYVSGTPFTYGFMDIMKYLHMNIRIDNEIIKINGISKTGCSILKPNKRNISNISNFILTEPFMTRIMDQLIIRHTKDDIDSCIKIPGYIDMIEWIELTDTERSIYNSKLTASRQTLQQLCCHPLIVDSMRRILTNGVVDLDQVQENLIDYHKKQIEQSTFKITLLDKTNQAYHMLLANYTSKISESKYMLTMLEKINTVIESKNEDITCVICFSEICYDVTSVLTSCGHLYCENCILQAIKYKSECPTCKGKLNSDSLYRIENKKKEVVNDTNPFITKYGGKLGKLIYMIRNLIMNPTNRIIIFSQWDDMLTLVGRSLSENGVANSFIKGNVHCRNKAIHSFKHSMTDDNRVIMLSLKNSASGTNLTEATHIFFIEPIDMKKDEIKMIEGQAIGRACRLGQKNTINVIRILCKNTIEEEIYNRINDINA
jgi:SNF2 family DNA or RNA helicase